jgi:hypothetical protein
MAYLYGRIFTFLESSYSHLRENVVRSTRMLTASVILPRLWDMAKISRVRTSGVITAPELKMFVTVKMQMSGLDAKGYAEKMGVPHQTIYAILSGARLPSKAMLKKLGLEVVYRIVPESAKRSQR